MYARLRLERARSSVVMTYDADKTYNIHATSRSIGSAKPTPTVSSQHPSTPSKSTGVRLVVQVSRVAGDLGEGDIAD